MPEYRMSFNETLFWLEEVKASEERKRQELTIRNNYPFLVSYYEGRQFIENFSDMTRTEKNMKKMAIINDYFPNINALIAEIMYQNPEIIVKSTKPDAETNSPIMQSALTYSLDKLDALTENKIALFDMIVAGYCGVEVNHINRRNVDVLPMAQDRKDIGIIGKIKESITGREIEEKVEKALPVKEIAYSTKDETYLRRWAPLDIGFDYRASRFKDCKYIYKILRWTHAEFAVRYPKLKDKIDASETLPFTSHNNAADKKVVILYEIQLRKADDTYHNFIISPDFKLHEVDYWVRPYTTNGFNMKIGSLHDYGVLYPISMGQINKALQDDINHYMTFMMQVAERNIPKRCYTRSKLKKDGEEALNNTKVNANVPVDGGQESVWSLPATNVSIENKELLAMFRDQTKKLWSVSSQRLGETGDADFAAELKIQEAGFQASQSDLQEGLRKLHKQEIDTLKDIIVQFWDQPMWFKITNAPKPTWYEPQMAEDGTLLNPLTDILTMDYELDVDIATSMKPNKERKKQELIEFANWITSQPIMGFLMSQGYQLNIDVVKKVAKEWGWNPDNLIQEIPEEVQQQMVAQAQQAEQGGQV